MINTNTVNLSQHLSRKDSNNQRNKADSSRSPLSSGGNSNFSKRSTPQFQNNNTLMLILQLIMQLIKQLQSQNPPKPDDTLELSADEKKGIQDRFGIFGEQNFSVADKDGDKKLSAGDVVSISGGVTGGHIRDITLSEADVSAISGKDLADAKAAFLENKEKWQANRPDKYSYTLQRSGFLTEDARKPVDLTVKGETVTDAKFSDGSKALVPDFNRLSVDSLFNTIEKAIDKGAAEVRVSYDKQTGIPTSIFIDQDKRIADEEISFTTSNFKPITEENLGKELQLNSKEQARALDFFGPFHTGGESVRIYDTNGDGKISKGDTAIQFVKPDPMPGQNPSEKELGRITLTKQQAATVNGTAQADTQKALDKNMQKWEDSGIKDYSYQFERSCFCPREITRPVDVTVREGEVTDAQFHDTKEGAGKPPAGSQQSVNNLFTIIQDSIDKGRQLEISYDAKTGMPTEIVIDRDQMPVDGGQTITASNLEIAGQGTDDIPLTKVQQEQTLNLFGYIESGNEKASILDKDGNGKISVGDIAMLNNQQYTLDEAAVRQITDTPTSKPLKLTEKQNEQALDIFSAPVERSRNHYVNIFDSNKDGKVSKGDIAIHMVTPSVLPAVVGYRAPRTEVERTTLTAAQAAQINGSKPVKIALTDEQDSALRSRFNLSRFEGYSVIDKDGNSSLSVGDELRIRRDKGQTPEGPLPAVEEVIKLTAEDIKAINASPEKELTLTKQQHENIAQHFNKGTTTYSGTVIDKDGSGDLSIGDIVKLSIGGVAGNIPVNHPLTASDLNAIQGSEKELQLTKQQHKSIASHFNKGTTTYNGNVIDKDGSGDLSIGDIVKLTIGGFAGNIAIDHPLTASDLEAIQGSENPLLDISKGISSEQKARLSRAIFPQNVAYPGNAPSLDKVVDNDKNGLLSVGDSIIVRRFNERSGSYDFSTQPLTQTQLDRYIAGESFNLDNSNKLDLTKEQHAAIGSRFNRLPPPGTADFPTISYEGIATDKDGDGKLSVGDTVTLKSSGGFRIGGDTIYEHVLKEADIAAINQDTSHPLLKLSKELTTEQRERLTRVLSSGPVNLGSVQSVFDGNSDGKISAGDTVLLERKYTGGGMGLSFHTLTQTDIDKFLANPKPPLGFEPPLNGTKWELSKIGSQAPYKNQHPSLTFSDNRVSFNDGINRNGGEYKSSTTGSFSAGRIAGTKIGSSDPAQRKDALAINQGISSASRYDISEDGKTLTFFDKNDQATLVYTKKGTAPELPIKITTAQDKTIRDRFNIGNNASDTYQVIDKDQSKSLSINDELAITRGNAVEVISLTAKDIAAITPSTNFTLEERLAYLDDKKFVSEEVLGGGLPVPTKNGEVIETGYHWKIDFNDGQFNFQYTDIIESGKYGISGNDIVLQHFNDRSTAFKVYPDQNAIELNGHRYIHEDSLVITH